MHSQHYRPFWLYFVAFAVIIAGLICYFWSTTRESAIGTLGSLTPTPFPSRITRKG